MITRARQWWAERSYGRRQGTTLALAVLLLVLLGWILWDRTRADQRAELARDNASVIAEQVREACRRQGDVAAELGDVCRQAEEVAAEPDVELVPGPAGPPGPPPSDEAVAVAVRDYLARNPPQPGRPPTMAEIADAVAIQLAASPPEQGERGPGPTREQVLAAVTDYLISNPPSPGPPGPPGEDGEDSTVPGPPGPAGENGEDGEGGEPPHSWTFTHKPLVGKPVTYLCERDDPFNPEEPQYTCRPVEG